MPDPRYSWPCAALTFGSSIGRAWSLNDSRLVSAVAAPPRSGKGRGIAVTNLLNWPGSTIVLDVKSELFDLTSGIRAAYGQQVLRFAPFDEEAFKTCRYNPLGYIRTDPLRRVADHESIAHVALVAVEYQAEVDEVAVVLAQPHGRVRTLPIGLRGVRADADQRRMPQPLDAQFAEHFGRRQLRLVLADARMHVLANAAQRGPRALAGALHEVRVETCTDGLA